MHPKPQAHAQLYGVHNTRILVNVVDAQFRRRAGPVFRIHSDSAPVMTLSKDSAAVVAVQPKKNTFDGSQVRSILSMAYSARKFSPHYSTRCASSMAIIRTLFANIGSVNTSCKSLLIAFSG